MSDNYSSVNKPGAEGGANGATPASTPIDPDALLRERLADFCFSRDEILVVTSADYRARQGTDSLTAADNAPGYHTIVIDANDIGTTSLYECIYQSLGISDWPTEWDAKMRHLSRQLRGFEHAFLMIENAQALAPRALDELSELGYLRTGRGPLLQCILSGTPELRETIAGSKLTQQFGRLEPFRLDAPDAHWQRRLSQPAAIPKRDLPDLPAEELELCETPSPEPSPVETGAAPPEPSPVARGDARPRSAPVTGKPKKAARTAAPLKKKPVRVVAEPSPEPERQRRTATKAVPRKRSGGGRLLAVLVIALLLALWALDLNNTSYEEVTGVRPPPAATQWNAALFARVDAAIRDSIPDPVSPLRTMDDAPAPAVGFQLSGNSGRAESDAATAMSTLPGNAASANLPVPASNGDATATPGAGTGQASAPVPRGEQARQIDALLAQGREALSRNYLRTPPEVSAWRYFNEVLQLEPENPEAIQGMSDIVTRYADLAAAAIRSGDYQLAQVHINRGLSVSDDNTRLLALQYGLLGNLDNTNSDEPERDTRAMEQGAQEGAADSASPAETPAGNDSIVEFLRRIFRTGDGAN